MIGLSPAATGVRLRITDPDARILRDLVGQLDDMLAARSATTARQSRRTLPDDPALARLLPDAFRDDPAASLEFRGLSEPDLIDHKRRNLATVISAIDAPDVLDTDAQRAWLQALTDLRLTIATRMGILGEARGDRPRSSDSTRALSDVFDWLGGVQAQLLRVATDPPNPTDRPR